MSTDTELNAELQAELFAEYQQFIAGFNSVILATASVNQDGYAEPESSYAPVLQHDDCFYIYVSALALHTRNLLQYKTASLLFIEDEAQAQNLFARRRVTLQVSAQEVARDSEQWQILLQAMQDKHGKMVGLLRTLNDFHLLKLTPVSGGYTAGFGKAYRLVGEGLNQLEPVSRR
ncbi:HugZ family protein [Thalassolituus sp. LLYu03]|uniref:HugZ family pyridoxamine 5'-phosphate oxidase n=1 Tax=Thalassolituus sp. LLYu03 TaxID=3421656 RepID=UPI003D276C6C